MDPHQCSFGQWLYGEAAQKKKAEDPRFAAIWHSVEKDHAHLHNSAKTVDTLMRQDEEGEALEVFMDTISPTAHKVLAGIDGFLALNHQEVAGMLKAQEIYANSTTPALGEAGHLVSQNVMTDEVMLQKAQSTKMAVSILCAFAVVAGIGLGIVITRSIIKALTRVMANLGQGSEQVTKEVTDILGEVVTGISRVGDLVAAVSTSNDEQSRSVGEINMAGN